MNTTTSTASSVRTSTLARLLATENLRIAHDPNLPSAAFDGKTRTLYLPNWRVDKQTYDMLVGHEVAHAKYTDFAQWTEAVDRLAKTKNQKAVVHDFINVVEDARIDRLIKRDYPGLRPDYKHGYGVLKEMDLFKIKGRTITVEDRLIDRINLHYKVGIHCGVSVPFTDEERTILDRINACSDGEKDFAKIVKIAEELYLREKAEMEEGQDGGEGDGESEESDEGKSKKSKKGKKSKKSKKGKKSESKKEKGEKGEKGEGEDGEGEGEDGEESDQDSDSQDGEESEGEGEGEGEDGDGEGEGEESDGEGEESDGEGEESDGEGKEATGASSEPSDASDEEYEPQMVNTAAAGRTGLQGLVDSSIVEQQIEIRPIDVSKIVVETAEFMSMFDDQCRVDHHIHNSSSPEKTRVLDDESMKAFRRVKDENKKSVDLMCRRFEVRRSARNFAKTTSQKSGRISPRLLKNYRFSEDIFDRMTVRSDEKNHGIVILLDWSGSMQGIIRESVSQLVATVEFCRRVGIPVQVYFFSSIYNKAVLDEVVRRNPSVNRKEMLANAAMGYTYHIPGGKAWSMDDSNNLFNEIVCGTTPQDLMEGKASHCSMFSLFKVYDSAAGQRRMVASLGRLILLSDAVGKFSRSRRVTIDNGPLSLGGTPLDESILAMRDIVNDFRKSSNTKVTLISITDGEGQSLINRVHSPYVGSKTLSRVIVDKETGRRFDLKDGECTTHSAAVQMFKDATGARIVGIRLESRESNYSLSWSSPWQQQEGAMTHANAAIKREAAEKKYAKDKFLSLEIPAYDGYCLVAIVRDDQADKMAEKAEVKGMAAKTIQTRQKNLEKSFVATMRQKQANRLFINTLMDVVAK